MTIQEIINKTTLTEKDLFEYLYEGIGVDYVAGVIRKETGFECFDIDVNTDEVCPDDFLERRIEEVIIDNY